MRTTVIPAVAALAGLAISSSAQAQPRDACFRMSQLQSTRAEGTQRVYFRVGVNTFYRLDLAHRCSSLPYPSDGFVLEPTGGRDLICGPLDLELKANDHGAIESCMVKSITRLTPEEAAAIPPRARP